MFKKFGLLLVCTGIILSLVACGGGSSINGNLSSDELQKLVLTGLEKWKDADSSGFEVNVDGKVNIAAINGSEAKNINFDVSLDGQQEIVDKEANKTNFTFNTSGNAKFEDSVVKFAAEFLGLDEMLYFNISKLDGLDTIDEAKSFAPMVEGYIGDWYSYALPSSALSDLHPDLPSEDEELTPEEQAQKDLYESTKFFSEIKVVGSDKIAGIKSDKIKLTLDKMAMIDYQVASSKLNGYPMTEEDIAQARTDMESFEVNLTVWIAQKEGYLTKVAGNAKGQIKDTQMDFDVNFDVVLKDFNKQMNFQAPKDATEFNPLSFLGGGAGMPSDLDMEAYGDMGDVDMSGLEGMENLDMSDLE